MFHIIVQLTAKNDKDIDTVESLLKDISRITLEEEPTCKRFEVYHSKTAPKVFILCEFWETEREWGLHREKRAFSEIYLPKVLPLVDREPHISELISENLTE